MNISHSTGLNCVLWVLQAKECQNLTKEELAARMTSGRIGTIAGAIQEAQCRRVTKKDLILEDERPRAISPANGQLLKRSAWPRGAYFNLRLAARPTNLAGEGDGGLEHEFEKAIRIRRWNQDRC